MTTIRCVRLWCDGPHHGDSEFHAPPTGRGFPKSMPEIRKLAADAGWAHVPHSVARTLDQDFCPDHKPEENKQ